MSKDSVPPPGPKQPDQPVKISVMGEKTREFIERMLQMSDAWIVRGDLSLMDTAAAFAMLAHVYHHKAQLAMAQMEQREKGPSILVPNGPVPNLKVRPPQP